jgi:hypothetical protein
MVALSKATPIEQAAVNDLADRIERDASVTDDDGWRPALDRLDTGFGLMCLQTSPDSAASYAHTPMKGPCAAWLGRYSPH